MAAQTGNTYFSGTMIDSVEIPKAIMGFPTMTSSKKVPQMIETITDMAGPGLTGPRNDFKLVNIIVIWRSTFNSGDKYHIVRDF